MYTLSTLYLMRQLNMSPLTLLLFLFGLTCSQVLSDLASEAIIGGHYAIKKEFKYQVSVQFGDEHCGGAIIADQFILTAAHCVTNESSHIVIQPYKVIAGAHSLTELKKAIIVHAESVYIHKQFNLKTHHDDIAILKLKHGLGLSHHTDIIEKVDLPKHNDNLENVDAVISGYGFQSIKVGRTKKGQWIEYGGTSDGKLKFAHVKITSHKRCVEAYPEEIIRNSLICGQVQQHHKHHYEGVCDGDSGSALVHGKKVVGILIANPFACNETTRPAKYTRVGSYLTLLNSVLDGKPDHDVAHAKVPH